MSKEFEKEDVAPAQSQEKDVVPLEAVEKTRWERIMPVIACGAGLFSDGYLNGVRVTPMVVTTFC